MNRLLVAVSFIALIALFAVRIVAPSDLYHQTQPKTVSYTTDIIANSNWILPVERGDMPATKPLLYNWIAVPFVKVFGYSSDWAHKMPSILALLFTFMLIVWLGEKVIPEDSVISGIGFLAGLMLVADYTLFKLGYLARPDMLLTLWLVVCWASATAILAIDNSKLKTRIPLGLVFVFWTSFALGWLTKGPAAAVALVYAIVGAKLITGRFSSFNNFKWWWGIPLSLLPFAGWLMAVYSVSPEHVTQTLWYDEFYGRIIGKGSEAPDEGAIGLLTRIGNMPAYYLARSIPWSVLSIIAMFEIWGKHIESKLRNWKTLKSTKGIWLHGAAIWVLIVLIFFTPSSDKRADYIASAFPIGALLASWWWLEFVKANLLRNAAPILAAAIVITAMGVVEFKEKQAPEPGYGENIEKFIKDVEVQIENKPFPVIFWKSGLSHLQAYLGYSMADDTETVKNAVKEHEQFWLIVGAKNIENSDIKDVSFLTQANISLTPVVVSVELTAGRSWPGVVTLWLCESENELD